MNYNFTETIFDKMGRVSYYAIYNSQIFFPSKKRNSNFRNDFIHETKERDPVYFYESGTIEDFRKQFLRENEVELQKYMSDIVDIKLLNKLRRNNPKNNLYANLPNFETNSKAKLIFNIAKEYYPRLEEIYDEIKESDFQDGESDKNYIPTLDDLVNAEFSSDKKFDNFDGIVTGHILSKLVSFAYRDFPNKQVVKIGRDIYCAKPVWDGGIIGDYKSNLLLDIENLTLEHAKKILQKSNNTTTQNEISDIFSKLGDDNHLTLKKINLKRIDTETYNLYIEINPFIFEYNGNYYSFKSKITDDYPIIKAGSEIKIRSNKVIITESPRIIDDEYDHPFVYSNKKICFAGDDRWNDVGLEFGKEYRLNDKNLPYILSYMLRETDKVLTQGYATNVTPVKRIDLFEPIAKSKVRAKHFAESNNINPSRIFLNGIRGGN